MPPKLDSDLSSVIAERQPRTIKVRVCTTCGLRATGSFLYGPPVCLCPNGHQRVTLRYVLDAVEFDEKEAR